MRKHHIRYDYVVNYKYHIQYDFFCDVKDYHITYRFPAAQIRFLAKSDPKPRGRQTSAQSCHRRKA